MAPGRVWASASCFLATKKFRQSRRGPTRSVYKRPNFYSRYKPSCSNSLCNNSFGRVLGVVSRGGGFDSRLQHRRLISFLFFLKGPIFIFLIPFFPYLCPVSSSLNRQKKK